MSEPMSEERLVEIKGFIARWGMGNDSFYAELIAEVYRLRAEVEAAEICKCGQPRAESCLDCAGW